MAIIYSYPEVTSLQATDRFIISRFPSGSGEISNYNLDLDTLSSYINTGQATVIQVDDRVVTGASFNTGSGLITLTRNGGDIPSVTTNLDGRYALTSSLATVATSGSYNDLSDQPTIPAAYTDADVDAHLNTSAAGNNEVLSWTGSDYDWVAQSGGGGGVTEITTTAPITGGTITTTGTIGITQASGSADGYLSSTDWNTFNSKSTFDGQFSSLSNTPTTIGGYGITDALQLGVTANTALAGNTTTITNTQATAIVTNSGKTSFPGFGTTTGTALEGDTSIPSSTSDLTNDSGFVEGTTSTQTAITEIKTLTSGEYASETKSNNVMYVIV